MSESIGVVSIPNELTCQVRELNPGSDETKCLKVDPIEDAIVQMRRVMESGDDARQPDGTVGPTYYSELSAITALDEGAAAKLQHMWANTLGSMIEEEREEYHTADGTIIIATSHERHGTIRYVKRTPVVESRRLRFPFCNWIRGKSFSQREVEPLGVHVPVVDKIITKRTYQVMVNDHFLYQIVMEWETNNSLPGFTSRTTDDDIKSVPLEQIEYARADAINLYKRQRASDKAPAIMAGISLAMTHDAMSSLPATELLTESFMSKVRQFTDFCISAKLH